MAPLELEEIVEEGIAPCLAAMVTVKGPVTRGNGGLAVMAVLVWVWKCEAKEENPPLWLLLLLATEGLCNKDGADEAEAGEMEECVVSPCGRCGLDERRGEANGDDGVEEAGEEEARCGGIIILELIWSPPSVHNQG